MLQISVSGDAIGGGGAGRRLAIGLCGGLGPSRSSSSESGTSPSSFQFGIWPEIHYEPVANLLCV